MIIHGDEAANYGRVIEIMDEVRTIEGAKLGMATQRGGIGFGFRVPGCS